jgi:hypothetical protein
MATETEAAVVITQELTAQQGRELFEKRCQELLGMAGDEFLQAYDSGEAWAWADHEDQVTELSMLVPFAR